MGKAKISIKPINRLSDVLRDRFVKLVWPDSKPAVLGAYINSNLVGVIFADKNEEYTSFDIAVLPKHQGKGIATKLLETFVSSFEEEDSKSYLRAVVSNRLLIPLLQRLGFFIIDGENGDECVMIYDPHNSPFEYQGFYL